MLKRALMLVGSLLVAVLLTQLTFRGLVAMQTQQVNTQEAFASTRPVKLSVRTGEDTWGQAIGVVNPKWLPRQVTFQASWKAPEEMTGGIRIVTTGDLALVDDSLVLSSSRGEDRTAELQTALASGEALTIEVGETITVTGELFFGYGRTVDEEVDADGNPVTLTKLSDGRKIDLSKCSVRAEVVALTEDGDQVIVDESTTTFVAYPWTMSWTLATLVAGLALFVLLCLLEAALCRSRRDD